MKRPRVVLDPTVFVAAALEPAGPSGLLLRRFLAGRELEAVVSEPLLADIEAAFLDPRVVEGLGSDAALASRWVGAYGLLATVVAVPAASARAPRPSAPWTTSLEALQAAGGGLLATVDPAALAAADLGAGVEVLHPAALLDILAAIAIETDRSDVEAAPGAPAARVDRL